MSKIAVLIPCYNESATSAYEAVRSAVEAIAANLILFIVFIRNGEDICFGGHC